LTTGVQRSHGWVVFLLALGLFGLAGVSTAPPARAAFQSSSVVAIINGSGASDAGTLPTDGTVDGSTGDDFGNFTFTQLDDSDIDPGTLAGYDTVVLNQVFTSDLSAAQESTLSAFVVAGGKLIIHDADGTSGNDYSWLPVPAESGQSCQNCGNTDGTAVIVESNQLVSDDPSSPDYIDVSELPGNTDAVGDANTFVAEDPRWDVDIRATNDNNVGGAVDGYASDGGLIIYNGLDTDDIGEDEPSGNNWLAKLWYQELALGWDPDTLPHTTPAYGGGGGPVAGCAGNSVEVGVVGVCANAISGVGSQIQANGNVTLDGGLSVGAGPIDIDLTTNEISTESPAPVALLRPGGPVALGTFGFTIAGNPVTDPVSGQTNLAQVTLSSANFGPLGALRIGGLPFTLPSSDGATLYLDTRNGGGLIGAGQFAIPFLGTLAPTASASLGFYATTPRVVTMLGASLNLGNVDFGEDWSFDGLNLTYQEPTDTWTASGGLTVPFASLKASGSLVGGRLNSISINVGNQTVPLGDSGFFFTDFGGSADGLVTGPLQLSASTAGFWGAPKLPVEPFYLDNATFTLDLAGSASLNGAVSFVLKDDSPVSGELHLKLGLKPFQASGSVVVDASLPEIDEHLNAGAAFTTSHFTVDGQGTLKIDLLSGTGEEIVSDKGVGASGTLCGFDHHFCQTMGFALTWTKVHDLLTGHLSALSGMFGADPTKLITVHAAAVGSPTSIVVPQGQSLLSLSFTSPTGPPHVELVDPHGKVYDTAKPPANMLVGTQPQFKLTSVTILAPLAGTWHVRNTPGSETQIQVQAQTIHAVHPLRTQRVTPKTSSRHPLATHKVVTLRWTSTGLPTGLRINIIESPHPGEISAGRTLASLTTPSGSLRLGVNRLTPGANYFALVATVNGVPFQRIGFPGSAWRR
jgi:hypothetical protein